MLNRFWDNIKNKKIQLNNFKEYSFMVKPFLCIAIIFAISISAIIRADYNYVDDLRRVAIGYSGWDNHSRFVSTFLSKIIHADKYLTDISPLPQMLAVAIMAMAAVIILYVYKNEKKFSIWDIIAIIPLGISPFFLECFSYKYDSPYMALSVLVSVLPLLFRKKKYTIYSIITILCTLIMCMTYQASSGIFLMVVLVICLKDWNEGGSCKENLKFFITSFCSYLSGLLIFKIFIMIPTDKYVSNHILFISDLISDTIEHFYQYFTLVVTDLKKEWISLIGLMCIFCVYIFTRDSKRKKYIAFPVSSLVLVMMLMLCFGVYPILKEPLFAPRAMYGVGVFVALIGVVISNSKKTYIPKIVVLVLSWAFIVFAFTYGNALKAQNEYTSFRVNLVIEDLNDLEIFTTDVKKSVQISGSIGQAPIIKNMPQDYQILKRLVSIQFREGWYWGKYYFYNYFGLRNIEPDYTNFKDADLPILKDTMYHRIKGNDKNILIELK